MKKIVLLAALFVLVTFGIAQANWSVTVTWTRSVGPNLASEECRLDGVVKGTVLPTQPTSCQFNVIALSGQQVLIRSINSQGAYSETTPIALSAIPAPASGVLCNITYIAP